MDTVALLGRAIDEVGRLVQTTTDDQLGDPTPCTEWKVRDLINHVVGGSTMFAISAEGGDLSDEVMVGLMTEDQLGDNFREAYKAATSRAMAAFTQPGVLDKTVKLPFGEMPAGVAAGIAVFDVTTHGCDLARATGQQFLDAELLEAALAGGKQMIGPDFRVPGMFGPEQPCASDASATERLLAFAGRKV
jgi:uncharacterized protein (TIGR03086 family)